MVKVFYTCAKADMEGNLYSTINGVDKVIDVVVWKVVVGIDMGGVRKFEESMDGYNKVQTYRGMLFDLVRILRNRLGVGGLTAKDKMLVYIITYILAPRSSNHAQVTDDDLRIIYRLKLGIQMNWVLLIKDIMLKSRQLVDYEFPYVVLASRFIDYFNINVSNEIVDFTKASNEIIERHLKKLDMTYVDHEWIMAREPPVIANDNQMEEEVEEEAQQWNPFESLMIQKLDVILQLIISIKSTYPKFKAP